jgi:hypothetical protein
MTSDSPHYIISPHALIKARTFGMYGAAEDRIRYMASQSSPFTHPVANRRFHQFLLKIEGNVVVDLVKLTPDEIARFDARPYAESDSEPVAEAVIPLAEPVPRRESYAQQWALKNRKA